MVFGPGSPEESGQWKLVIKLGFSKYGSLSNYSILEMITVSDLFNYIHMSCDVFHYYVWFYIFEMLYVLKN